MKSTTPTYINQPGSARQTINLVPCGLGMVAARLTDEEWAWYLPKRKPTGWVVLVHRQACKLPDNFLMTRILYSSKCFLDTRVIDSAGVPSKLSCLYIGPHAASVLFLSEGEVREVSGLIHRFNYEDATGYWKAVSQNNRALAAYREVGGNAEHIVEFVLRTLDNLCPMPAKGSLTMRLIAAGVFGNSWVNRPVFTEE